MRKAISRSLNQQSGFILPILILLTLIMIVVAGYLFFKGPEVGNTPLFKKIGEQVEKKVKVNKEPEGEILSAIAEIAITKDGFMPATIKVIPGQQVTFVNQDNNSHRVIPYPMATRNALPGLDSEDLQPTDSFIYSFEKTGTFTISESINPGKFTATVVVN